MYKKFFKDLGIKTIKTFCQSLAGGLTAVVLFSSVDWVYALDAALLAAFYCVVSNIGFGLPGGDEDGEEEKTAENKNGQVQ